MSTAPAYNPDTPIVRTVRGFYEWPDGGQDHFTVRRCVPDTLKDRHSAGMHRGDLKALAERFRQLRNAERTLPLQGFRVLSVSEEYRPEWHSARSAR